MANIKIDFYRVQMPEDTQTTFEQIIDRVRIGPNDANRNEDYRGVPVRLQESSAQGDWRYAEMIRIRLDEVPLRASLSVGSIGPFDFEEDEGIGEETAFLYNTNLRVMALQRNRFGVSPNMISLYFTMKGHTNRFIVLQPIIQLDAFRRVSKFGIIRKFDIRIAGLENFQDFRGMGYSGHALAGLMENFRAPTVSVSLSMGKGSRRGSLSIEAIMDEIRSAMRLSESNAVQKIEVTGREYNEAEIEVIDLLKDRMTEMVEVQLDQNRRIPYEGRKTALREALRRRSDELARMFVLPGD